MRFGLKMAIMRKVRDMKQADVAAIIGTSRTQVSFYENGWAPDDNTARDIRFALGWGPEHDALLDGLEKVHES